MGMIIPNMSLPFILKLLTTRINVLINNRISCKTASLITSSLEFDTIDEYTIPDVVINLAVDVELGVVFSVVPRGRVVFSTVLK